MAFCYILRGAFCCALRCADGSYTVSFDAMPLGFDRFAFACPSRNPRHALWRS